MASLACDVMQTGVLTVSPETTLADLQRLFVEEGISGAPVVDADGRLAGVVSVSDLLRAAFEERDTAVAEASYFREDLEFSAPAGAGADDLQDRLAQLRVADAMTPGTLWVPPDAPVSEIADLVGKYRVHRVLVVDDGALVGIVSTFDLVALLAKGAG